MRLRQVARASATVFGGNLLASASNFTLALVVARAYGPEGRGELAVFVLVPMLASTVLGFGLPTAHAYWGAKHPDRVGTFAWNSVLTAGTVGVVLAVVGASVGERLPVIGGVERPALVLVAIPLQLVTILLGELLPVERRYRSYAAVRAGSGLLPLVLVVAAFLALPGRPALGDVEALIFLGWLGAAAASLLLNARSLATGRPSLREHIVALRYAVLVGPALVLQMVNYRLDQVVLAALLPRETLGLYAASVSITEGLFLPAASMATVLLPEIARRPEPASRALVHRSLALAVAGTAAAGLLVFATAPVLLRLLYGEEFVAGAQVLRVLALTIPVVAFTKIAGAGLAGTHRQAQHLRAVAAAAVVTVVAVPSLVTAIGAVGAALASLGAYLTSALVQWIGWRSPARSVGDRPEAAPDPMTRVAGT
ncbi:MAG TPA: polysaccharide biosynthesis C-terminal domain-containing protein [Actinomycetota bacterium]|nr:polysaccharide biosynthesis C-terminal domain-containing protein [Actinomycetota bacterium]